MAKRTFASVTEVECGCHYLSDLTLEPGHPVKFDQRLREFSIEYKDSMGQLGSLLLYHCPFCGGALPESRRSELFAKISEQEERRLQAMLAPVRTVEDAFRVLGPPDSDMPNGVGVHKPGCPPQWFRTLIYSGLSSTADVTLALKENNELQMSLQGKYVGLPPGEA